MSSRGVNRLWITAAALVAFALPAVAQYQGEINTNKNTLQLRAVGVFEWTGDQDHPKNSRLVPLCIYDGQELQDASVYMARPAPLALDSDVEYQLMKDGRPIGLFDISSAANQLGLWIGLGAWKPLPKPKGAAAQIAKIDAENDAQSDVPILHRKQHADDPGTNAHPPDPNRPTLHKDGDASDSGSGDRLGDGRKLSSTRSRPAGSASYARQLQRIVQRLRQYEEAEEKRRR